ncbi:MAG: RDD family protein [Reichenbachiella sp.]|uniref:RDD family protein n=1 Tax=Reichenbachiella sp. TaxID=2184521 RepID=UPI00326344A5
MPENEQVIDQPMGGGSDGKDYVIRNKASSGKRFANLIIDTIIFYILVFMVGVFSELLLPGSFSEGESDPFNILFPYLIMILYYWFMEASTGKTVGKYITRTKVVKEDGSEPTTINILGRTMCRFIPFDVFTYLGSSVRGWHDSIPNLYVIEE